MKGMKVSKADLDACLRHLLENERCGQMDRRAKQRNAYCSEFRAAYERRKVLDGTDLLYGRLCLWLRIHVSRTFH
jgi:hypothetical protein